MRMIILAAAGLAGLALAGWAPPEPPVTEAASGERECFYARQARTFSAGDGGTIYVRTGMREVFELQAAGACPDIDWSRQIGLVPRGGGTRVCTGSDLDLVVSGPTTGSQRCQVRSVRKLSDEEAALRR